MPGCVKLLYLYIPKNFNNCCCSRFVTVPERILVLLLLVGVSTNRIGKFDLTAVAP